ncbi:MAG TPA: hypothetical protein VMT45_02665 [Thermoanaerobaculaceae bacterium]|nr:hypothetical protein [Thermoanaerobaculaceae bacterium]
MRRDDDTPEVVTKDGTRAEYQDADVEPGERAEIVVEPASPMRDPTLYLSTDPRDAAIRVEVETVYHGQVAVLSSHDTADRFRHGMRLHLTVTRTEPVRVVVSSDVPARVGVSLVVDERPNENGD